MLVMNNYQSGLLTNAVAVQCLDSEIAHVVTITSSTRHTYARECSVLVVTLRKTNINILGQVSGNVLAEYLNILSVNLSRESKCSIDDTSIEAVEALCYLVRAGVVTVECGNKSSFFAIVVKLKVDRALGKDSAFELVEIAGDLRVAACFDETVLKYVAEL